MTPQKEPKLEVVTQGQLAKDVPCESCGTIIPAGKTVYTVARGAEMLDMCEVCIP